MIALLLAFLASFSAPGAALAHGSAHLREHHGAHAPRTAAPGRGHDHQHAHAHHEREAVAATVETERRVAGVSSVGPTVVSQDEPDRSHGHPTLDLPVRPRVELAALLPLLAVATLIASPELAVVGGTPVPHAALARPDPDAAPPPRTRAPPLR